MKIEVEKNSLLNVDAESLVIGIFENIEDSKHLIDEIDAKLDGSINERIEIGDFKGKMGQISTIYTRKKIPAKRILLVGLGKKEDLDYERIRRVSGIVIKKIRDSEVKKFKIWLMGLEKTDLKVEEIARAITEGAILGNYKFYIHKTEKLDEIKLVEEFSVVYNDLIDEIKNGIRSGQIIAEATNFSKDLTNEPANIATPTYIAEQAKKMADELGIKCNIYGEKEIEEMKMGSFLSVARGSNEPCKLVVLDYNPNENLETIVLIGKGITFDTGGISIKPSMGMWEMKQDMAGAAAVIGALKAISQLKSPLHIVGITPLTENTPGGRDPNLPGDIVKSRKGKTIEILHTDAEGRLILIDVLDYANEFKPKVVVDIATLTGACAVALGIYASGLFTTDDDLANKLIEAGEETQERLWRLPLWKDHEKIMESKIADVRNINPNRKEGAGASNAAGFLKHFIGDYRWAHIDIAGTDLESKGKDYTPPGASGVGVRLIVQFLKNWGKKSG
ncbi:MAG: leucyl aminopeptidase [Candidatus Helarchaeota archaeon]|nr:leucyl aminopeptidase [Candidatus Helarchaeota archaeon]